MKPCHIGNWKIKRVLLTEMMFANDIVITAESETKLQHNVDVINEQLK